MKPIGESVTLICEAKGNPPSTLTWMKDGQPLISSIDGAFPKKKNLQCSFTTLKIIYSRDLKLPKILMLGSSQKKCMSPRFESLTIYLEVTGVNAPMNFSK